MLNKHHSTHVSFPLWQFLAQPVSTSTQVILNPFQFQHKYYIQLLERCWNYDSIQLLKRCWVKELELERCPSASEGVSKPIV